MEKGALLVEQVQRADGLIDIFGVSNEEIQEIINVLEWAVEGDYIKNRAQERRIEKIIEALGADV